MFYVNNKQLLRSLCLATMCCLAALTASGKAKTAATDYVPNNYVWTTQSSNSSESMPCGGCDVGMNVWVEQGDVLFYVSKSGMFDENNTLLKAGRIRLSLDGDPFGGSDFRQTLCLDDGAVYITGGGVTIRLWADVYESVVFAELTAATPVNATLSYESWRYKDRPVTKAECQQGSWKWQIPSDCTTYQDTIRPNASGIDFWHENRAQTVFDYTVKREALEEIKDSLPNPIGGLRFGGSLSAPAFRFTGTTDGTYASTDFRAWTFKASRIKTTTIRLDLATELNGERQPQTKGLTAQASRRRSSAWWHAYWQRSYIKADGPMAQAARNYELFRYMLGCNAYGQWPTKFNGGLFTFDPVYVDANTPFTPDYRRWGGGTMTAQNQRLVYWGMLKSGDTDMMASQFNTYLRMLPAATARTRHYWHHDGASFTEQIENFGLPNPAEYGKHTDGSQTADGQWTLPTDYGMERNAWLEYLWDTSLEFCSMMLLANDYANLDITPYEGLIRECVTFFDEHYQYLARLRGVKPLNADGKLVLYPSSGCETYKMAYNASSTIAALQAVIAQCEQYDSTAHRAQPLLDPTLKDRLPALPLHTINGDTCIAPALVWERIQNVETPQLYPVFPWRIYGLGRDGLDIARNTYSLDPHALAMRSITGWKQDNIWAACLGISDEAMSLNSGKLADGPYRFPAFWDQGFDWAPDCNRGGAGMIGLQEMLLQETPDGQPLLFPAWDTTLCGTATFRLHASNGRTIDATINPDGTITSTITYNPQR